MKPEIMFIDSALLLTHTHLFFIVSSFFVKMNNEVLILRKTKILVQNKI